MYLESSEYTEKKYPFLKYPMMKITFKYFQIHVNITCISNTACSCMQM